MPEPFDYGWGKRVGGQNMRILNSLMIGGLCFALAGCSIFGGNGGPFGVGRIFGDGGASAAGLPFRAQLRRGDDPRNFVVTARAGGVGVGEARESVRFPATRYCLETYGASDVDWVIDPETGDWAFSRAGQDMVFQGRCTAR